MLLTALLAAVATAKVVYDSASTERTTTEEDYWKQWVDFVKRETMEFENFAHHNERFKIFQDNIDKINRHNAKKLSWRMGVTPFAHLTEEEFKTQIVGSCTLPEKAKDAEYVLLDESNLADSVDWVEQGKVTPVKNQGQCGSCWAFSTTGSVESRFAIATGKLNQLSEQELVDCSGSDGNMGCNGGLMDYGFKYVVEQHGLCDEQAYAYVAKTKKLECNRMRSACGAREDAISSWQDVTPNSESQLQAAVAQGPVSVAIEADQTSFQLYKDGVMEDRCGTKLDHGVLAVGYGHDAGEGLDFWKVKNSWGPNWGENGYIRMCRNCNKNAGKGQCGIAGQPSFPVV